MSRPMAEADDRLERFSEICLSLPKTKREVSSPHAIFTVNKKVFAYFVSNHHGDGIIAINCKVPPGENTALIASQPKRFYMPAYIGPRGWVGLRLDVGRISWNEVKELTRCSYELVSKKRLPVGD